MPSKGKKKTSTTKANNKPKTAEEKRHDTPVASAAAAASVSASAAGNHRVQASLSPPLTPTELENGENEERGEEKEKVPNKTPAAYKDIESPRWKSIDTWEGNVILYPCSGAKKAAFAVQSSDGEAKGEDGEIVRLSISKSDQKMTLSRVEGEGCGATDKGKVQIPLEDLIKVHSITDKARASAQNRCHEQGFIRVELKNSSLRSAPVFLDFCPIESHSGKVEEDLNATVDLVAKQEEVRMEYDSCIQVLFCLLFFQGW